LAPFFSNIQRGLEKQAELEKQKVEASLGSGLARLAKGLTERALVAKVDNLIAESNKQKFTATDAGEIIKSNKLTGKPAAKVRSLIGTSFDKIKALGEVQQSVRSDLIQQGAIKDVSPEAEQTRFERGITKRETLVKERLAGAEDTPQEKALRTRLANFQKLSPEEQEERKAEGQFIAEQLGVPLVNLKTISVERGGFLNIGKRKPRIKEAGLVQSLSGKNIASKEAAKINNFFMEELFPGKTRDQLTPEEKAKVARASEKFARENDLRF
jgi:hypothetical protein